MKYINNTIKERRKESEQFIKILEKNVEHFSKKKINSKMKIRQGKTVYHEKFWYTDYTCFKEKFRWQYSRAKYTPLLFDNVSEYEYEGNEFFFCKETNDYYFIKGNPLKDLTVVTALLITQLRKVKESRFVILIEFGGQDDMKPIWMYFFENRKEHNMLARLSESPTLTIFINE